MQPQAKTTAILATIACTLVFALAGAAEARANTTPVPSVTPTIPAQSFIPHWSVDPCALLGSNDLTGAVGAMSTHPQHPTADECLWNAALNNHTPNGVRQVLLTVDAADAGKNGCKGLECVAMVRAITGYIPGLDKFNQTVDTLGSGAELISGLGDKAAWGHGILAVLENDTIFKLQLSGTQSDLLSASELLAQKVIDNMSSH